MVYILGSQGLPYAAKDHGRDEGKDQDRENRMRLVTYGQRDQGERRNSERWRGKELEREDKEIEGEERKEEGSRRKGEREQGGEEGE